MQDNKPVSSSKKTVQKITLQLKKEYEEVSSVSSRRSGVRKEISTAEIKHNPVRAIYDHHLEYLFNNTPEELTEVIYRVDKKKGLTEKKDYKTRALRGVAAISDEYNVL